MNEQYEYNSSKPSQGKPISVGMRVLLCIGSWFVIAIICELITLMFFGQMSTGGLVALVIAIVLTAMTKTNNEYSKLFTRSAIAGVILAIFVCLVSFSMASSVAL